MDEDNKKRLLTCYFLKGTTAAIEFMMTDKNGNKLRLCRDCVLDMDKHKQVIS